VAALLRARLDGARGIGAAGGLRDGEEGLGALAHRGDRVLFYLGLAARPDGRRRHPAEDAAAGVVEAHAVLGHLLERYAHAESVEPTAAVFFLGAEGPEARRLRLGGQAREVFVGNV